MPSTMQKFISTVLGGVFFTTCLLACDGARRTGQTSVPASAQRSGTKNIIVMICDGMGYNHYQAASLFLYGEPDGQTYNAFPVRVGMSTFPAGGQYDPAGVWADFDGVTQGATDSAAAATAMATGRKTYRYAVGVDTGRRDLRNVVEVAEKTGRATGVITSVPFSHATPAAFVVHSPTRNNYEEIARDMLEESGLEVLMGCGHPWYDDDGRRQEPSSSYRYIGGEKTWKALQQGTLGNDCDGDGINDPWVLIQDRQSFVKLAEGETPKRIVGIAKVAQTLQQKRAAGGSDTAFSQPFIESVPTLVEMTGAALNVLDDDPDGFFLMVEGGAIDWASHANQSGRMIEEQIAFDRAVARVIEWVETHSSWKETLLIVTADHECGFLNGAGPVNRGMLRQPAMQWQSRGHTNALVPLFAKGAGAELFKNYYQPEVDPVRGRYVDNVAVGQLIMSLLANR
ncbi:MAG: alkaline phosphatase [Pedobacter sp.]